MTETLPFKAYDKTYDKLTKSWVDLGEVAFEGPKSVFIKNPAEII